MVGLSFGRLAVWCWLLWATNGTVQAQAAPPIAAASDLKFALDAVEERFKAETGRALTITYGSSGNFTNQLMQNAPFQLFFSADEEFVRQLARAGKTQDEGTLYAIGRIVFFVPRGSSVNADISDLRAATVDGRLKKFAIANPEHAPYGRAAEEALRYQGIWDGIRSKLVLGENVSQAAQFATSGSTQGGIFAYSLVFAPQIGKVGTFELLPAEWHKPLRQRMVLLKNAGEDAKAFYAYVQSRPAREVFKKYGFGLPGEGP